MDNHSVSTETLILTGMMTAVTAVLSQIQFPLPSGIPVTLQTFSVALAAYVLGWKMGTASVAVYILLGAVGVPVFAGFSGGISVIAGLTGGYIWGFLIMALFCGLAREQKNLFLTAALSLLGLAGCHIPGRLRRCRLFCHKSSSCRTALRRTLIFICGSAARNNPVSGL